MKYTADNESLKTHPVPEWYDDAKLGIFIHWGLYSVPAFADPGEQPPALNKMDFAEMPYAEWYQNKLRIKGSSTRDFHYRTYGRDYPYEGFQAEFEAHTRNFDASEWAWLAKAAGARYSILTTKHHDGYLLWPSRHKNTRKEGYASPVDLIAEVVDKMRAIGMKTGLYYSGVMDWTYSTKPAADYLSWLRSMRQGQEYVEYAVNHFFELIDRYNPDILWNDIGFPHGYDLTELFAYYYNRVEDGVINDRWNQVKVSPLLTNPLTAGLVNRLITAKLRKVDTEEIFKSEPEGKIHTDYRTPEYCQFREIQQKKFEVTRGLGYSFAYNRLESETHLLTGRELIHMLADIVSKNGNLLINIGPRADGSVPEMQKKPLLELGAWLNTNGEAIYGTRPWRKAEGMTTEGMDIRYTSKIDTVYAVILGNTVNDFIIMKNLKPDTGTSITLLSTGEQLKWSAVPDGTMVHLPGNRENTPAHVLKLTGI